MAIQYQGCFDASAQNALLSQTPSTQAQISQTGVAFGTFNSSVAVQLLPAGSPAGTYRMSAYLVPTTSFVTNTTENISAVFTDDSAAQTVVVASAGLTSASPGTGSVTFRSTGAAAISYKPVTVGTAATAGAASFSVILERLF